MHWPSFSHGFLASAALILAIGAQNMFVLRLGLERRHVLPVVLLCMLSDAALIAAGVLGLGALLGTVPWLLAAARWGGVAFLTGYALLALRRAWRADNGGGNDAVRAPRTLGTALGMAAAFTFLNPHCYLDTVVLLGTIGGSEPAGGQIPFILGASVASAVWFFALGFGARGLSPLFARPGAWRALDGAVGTLMLVLAVSLALR